MKTKKEYECEECEHKEVTYREYDTGYEEWKCNLSDTDCNYKCLKENKIIKMEE